MKSILVVDDIFSIRLAIQDFLSPHFTVVTAGDGQEALEILSERRFDLLLSDIRMPGMSGIELIQHVPRLADGRRHGAQADRPRYLRLLSLFSRSY